MFSNVKINCSILPPQRNLGRHLKRECGACDPCVSASGFRVAVAVAAAKAASLTLSLSLSLFLLVIVCFCPCLSVS